MKQNKRKRNNYLKNDDLDRILYFFVDRCDGTMCMFNFIYTSIKNKCDVILNSNVDIGFSQSSRWITC
jgi:hypothetical protein